MMTGQEFSNGPGGGEGRSLLRLTQLTAFVDGVHEKKEGLLRRLYAEEWQEDTSEEKREKKVW